MNQSQLIPARIEFKIKSHLLVVLCDSQTWGCNQYAELNYGCIAPHGYCKKSIPVLWSQSFL